jgi:hypothetical protein
MKVNMQISLNKFEQRFDDEDQVISKDLVDIRHGFLMLNVFENFRVAMFLA